MRTVTRTVLLTGLLAIATVTASCSDASGASPAPTVCDDVSSDVGGCTTDRHAYIGATCDAVATEWGGVMDRAVLDVMRGPANVDDQARSSRLRQAIVIATVDMDRHLETLSLSPPCTVDAVLAAGEAAFVDELRSGVGAIMYDGDPVVSYAEWIADVRKVLGVIEQ